MAARVSPTPSAERSCGSGSSREQWTQWAVLGGMDSPPANDNDDQPPSLATPEDESRASLRPTGQWDAAVEATFGSFQSPATPPALPSTKELDAAIGDLSLASTQDETADEEDVSSACRQSEVTYDHSEATARTGHLSSFPVRPGQLGHFPSKPVAVTPDASSTTDDPLIEVASRDASPPRPRRLVACGAGGLDVTDELKGSLQDVGDTVRQIFGTVRRFGPDEKDALREAFRDASMYVRGALRRDRRGGAPEDEEEKSGRGRGEGGRRRRTRSEGDEARGGASAEAAPKHAPVVTRRLV